MFKKKKKVKVMESSCEFEKGKGVSQDLISLLMGDVFPVRDIALINLGIMSTVGFLNMPDRIVPDFTVAVMEGLAKMGPKSLQNTVEMSQKEFEQFREEATKAMSEEVANNGN